MERAKAVTLGDVENTGLLTAFCHALASRSPGPLLRDPMAERICDGLAPLLADAPTALLRNLARGKVRGDLVVHIALRARRYDAYGRAFLERHGGGCVLNLGCGLDTRFWRINDERLRQYDVDLPRMVALKKQFVEETDRYHLIGRSVLEHEWMDQIAEAEEGPFLVLAEGLFMYLPERGAHALVRALQARFPGCELAFETVNSLWLRPWVKWMVNWKMQRELGLGPEAQYLFGMAHGRELEALGDGVHYLDEWSYLDEDEPRIGPLRWFRGWQFLRQAQWTVRYLLAGSERAGRQ